MMTTNSTKVQDWPNFERFFAPIIKKVGPTGPKIEKKSSFYGLFQIYAKGLDIRIGNPKLGWKGKTRNKFNRGNQGQTTPTNVSRCKADML